MTRLLKFAAPALFLAAGFAARPARAADGRIPVSAAGQIIAPGDYYLTRDISVASGYAIGIYSNGVTLDLGGHTVTAAAGSGWAVFISGVSHVRVTNGNLAGGYYGLQYSDTGTGGPPGTVRLDHLHVTGSSNYGMLISANAGRKVRAVIESNEIYPAAGTCLGGIRGDYLLGGKIADNQVNGCVYDSSNGANLTLFNSSGVEVARNTFSDSSDLGISLSGSSRNSIHHNIVSGNTFGIVLFTSDNNSIDWNFFSGNAANPIYIGSGNTNIYSYNRYTGNSPNAVSDSGSGNISGGGNCAPAGCS